MMRFVRAFRLVALSGTLGMGLCASGAAQAELGGTVASVQTDRAAMNAQMRTTSLNGRAVHELTRPNGGSVKEFTNAKGQVYAVTWSGPGKPDLRSLLGAYFDTFQADNAHRTALARRRPAQVNRPDLSIQTGGHMGYFWGVALIPSLAPAGFSPADLQ